MRTPHSIRGASRISEQLSYVLGVIPARVPGLSIYHFYARTSPFDSLEGTTAINVRLESLVSISRRLRISVYLINDAIRDLTRFSRDCDGAWATFRIFFMRGCFIFALESTLDSPHNVFFSRDSRVI